MQGLVQHFGSCWFYSSWNGFLLSFRGRKFLREFLSYERPESTHNVFWTRTKQFLNHGPFTTNAANETAILSVLNAGVNPMCIGSNYHTFKALSVLFGNKIAYNLNLHTNSTPLPLVILKTYSYTANNNNQSLPRIFEFKGKNYIISHCRVNFKAAPGAPAGHSMTGAIAMNGKEFIFDSGLIGVGEFWEFDWTNGPIRDPNGDPIPEFESYDVFFILEDLMTLPNKPVYVRQIPGRPPMRRAKRPVAAPKNNNAGQKNVA